MVPSTLRVASATPNRMAALRSPRTLAAVAGILAACGACSRAGSLAAHDTPTTQQVDEAIALLRRGRADAVLPLLRHTPDPTLRTQLIHELGRRGADPSVILRRLDVERDVSARRALILSLGHFAGEQLPPRTRQPLVAKLLEWYRHDPDPGVHAAIDWLLRYGRQGEKPRALDWQQADTLAAIDRALAGRAAGHRNWYVTREAQTMTIVRGPVEFHMGSPVDEKGRMPASDSPEETVHLVRIPRSFAISTKEVTIGQFRRFLDANPEVKRRHVYPGNPGRMAQVLADFSPDEDGPQIAVTWYEAAAYCNWLSKQEGLPESEWVYPSDVLDIKSGMELPNNYLHRTGYRLPTEAEWEYAARAGSTTARFYGASEGYLKEYAWYAANPPTKKDDPVDPNDPQRTWPVGQLKPNDLGLFDVYGNVWEWTQNRMHRSAGEIRDDAEDQVLVVTDSTARPRRGGGFPYGAAAMRSAGRGTINAFPTTRRDNVGFRIARTLRP
jgi:formylglycine-generating enzyme required for sulfatase activity